MLWYREPEVKEGPAFAESAEICAPVNTLDPPSLMTKWLSIYKSKCLAMG
jgi:hypothetical protein